LMERTGWSGMTKHFGMPDHPVCGDKLGYAAFFLLPQPPLLYQEGSCRPPTVCNTPQTRDYILIKLPAARHTERADLR